MIYAVPLNDRFEKRERDIFAPSPPPTATPLVHGPECVLVKMVCLVDSARIRPRYAIIKSTVVTGSHYQIGAIGRRGDLSCWWPAGIRRVEKA